MDIIFHNSENYAKMLAINTDLQRLVGEAPMKNDIQRLRYSKDIQIILRRIISAHEFIDEIYIYDIYGNTYSSYDIDPNTDMSEKDIQAFIHGEDMKVWQDTIVGPYAVKNTLTAYKKNVVTLTTKMNDMTSGISLGVIRIFIDENSISDLLKEINRGEGVFIVNDEGMVIAHTNDDMLYERIVDEDYYPWLIGDYRGGKYRARTQQEDMLIIKYYNATYGWHIIEKVPYKMIYRDIERIRSVFLVVGSFILLIASIIIALISKTITKPLIILKNAMQNVSSGDLETKVFVQTQDEVGVLSEEFNHMTHKTKLLMKQVLDEQKRKRQYEYLIMQAQINPHFLYNTLETICGLAEVGKNKALINMVNHLAYFYRGLLSNGKNMITVEQEIDIAQRYLEILKVRYNDKFDYLIDVEQEVMQHGILKLVLQPLLENAIQHGFHGIREKGFIWIKGYKRDEKLVMQVIDNGCGIPESEMETLLIEEQKNNQESFGLHNIHSRIQLYFGLEYGLFLHNCEEKGLKVELLLPLDNGLD